MSYEEEKQDRKIERLEAEIERLRVRESELLRKNIGDHTFATNEIGKMAARIQELEDALVEKQTALMPSAPRCYADARRQAAIEQLQAEGKIGPNVKPREGLYGKYRISKADGSPVDPEADYFVLRLDTDPVARRAAREYSYMTVDRKLALDLQERITKYNPKMMDCINLQFFGEDCINLQFFGVEKPRVWQITEERKEAFGRILRRLEYDQSLPGRTNYKIQRAMELLRAMLEGAAQ